MTDLDFTVSTDGSCLGNPGPGGWGAVLKDSGGGRSEASGCATGITTSSAMELRGLLEALQLTPAGATVLVRMDAEWIVKAFTERWVWDWERSNWRKRSHADTWKAIVALVRDRTVTFAWVASQSSDPDNARADRLAYAAAMQARAANHEA